MSLSRLPVRVRLAAAFSAGLLVVLALAGTFVYIQVGNDLSDALDSSLAARADDVATIVRTSDPSKIDLGGVRAGEGESTFTQIVRPDGVALQSTLGDQRPVISREQIRQARNGTLRLDGLTVDGIEGQSRIVAIAVDKDSGTLVAIVGATTRDRAEALSGISRAFALGAPLALLVASGIGYLLGARALAPVEAMRSRARQITFDEGGERLPVPVAEDELHNLADTLNEMLDRVDEALRRERVFVADASHELRTPLAILKSEIELVRRTGGSQEELEEALDSAAEEVDHLVQLAEDLLVIARADQGRLPIRREPVDIAALADRVRRRFEAAAERDGRQLVFEDDCGEYPIDRLRIEQALSNLVDNALRHGGGTVKLNARAGPDQGLELSVSDEGPGFPETFRAEAFERFTQADGGRSETNAGLGLAIVRAVARAHGGEATIAPDAGNGAVVRVSIPPQPTH